MGWYSAPPDAVWRISVAVSAAAYLVMAFAGMYFLNRRRDVRYGLLAVLFVAALLGAGITRGILVVRPTPPVAAEQETSAFINAVFSTVMALIVVRMIPSALNLASRDDLEKINRSLRDEAQARNLAEERLRRVMENKHRASEAKLSSYFESASQGIIAVSADGHIVLANRRTEEMFGYGREELLGHELELLLPERYRATHIGHRAGYFAEPHMRAMGAGMDLAGRRKDGTEFPVEIGLSFVEDEVGLLAFGLVTDITERKGAADQIARINAELRRSNAELEQFAYVASHDLQEPLRMITSYLHLLERRYNAQLDADAQEFVHFAVDGANRMKVLIRDLLSISRAGTEAVKSMQVPGNAILQNALGNLKAAIDESGAMITSDLLPTIFADPGLMARIFQNLIGNAIKFNREKQPQVHVSAQLKGLDYVFSVRDNGIGIEPKHADRIFQIFQRLHGAEDYPGTGIGLAISKKIVERHGGRIWLESAPGRGSTFYFSIPSKADASRELQQAAST